MINICIMVWFSLSGLLYRFGEMKFVVAMLSMFGIDVSYMKQLQNSLSVF
jgi:hypothetical protein